MTTILQKIIARKREEVAELKQRTTIDQLRHVGAPRGFAAAVRRHHPLSIIAEIKRASPSKGIIRADLDPEIATLTVKGRPELMKTLVAEDLRLFVDATEISGSAPAKLPIRAVLPSGVILVRTEPVHATVRLKD